MSWQTRIYILIFGLVLFLSFGIWPHVQSELVIFARLVLGILAVSLIVFAVLAGLLAREAILDRRAKRKGNEHQSRVINTEHGTWFIAHKDIDVVPLHSTPYLRINGHERDLTPDEIFYTTALHAPKQIALESTTVPLETIVPDLLPILDNSERVLVKGPSNSGKTTLFQNITSRSANCIVIDPHYAPGLWPEHCQILGKGRNHDEITGFFNWLSSELDKRYKLRSEGNESYPLLTIIIDEWMSIANKCDNATSVITEMITESRKSKMRLFIGSHSDQVEALGIRGQGKLREGLLIVRLSFDQFTNERSATFDYGRGERPCKVPASYTPIPLLASGKFELPELKVSNMIIDKQFNPRQLQAMELIEQGRSNAEIAEQVYHKPRLAGQDFYEVKAVRDYLTTTTLEDAE